MKHLEPSFKDLNSSLRAYIKELLNETLDKAPEHYRSECTSIEYISRDGFLANPDNFGGLTVRAFTDLSYFWASGVDVTHDGASREIKRQIDISLEMAREGFFENNESELREIGVTSASMVDYHALVDADHSDLAERFFEYEYDNLSDDQSSIMFETRFLYHGVDETGAHSASVSCAVNTEGPYHRSSIPWAPGVFCEGAKEVTFRWRTDKGLKRLLAKALKQTSGKVF